MKQKLILFLLLIFYNLSFGGIKMMVGNNNSGILGSNEFTNNSISYELEISRETDSKFFDMWSFGINLSEIGMENLNCRIDKTLSNTTSIMDVYVKIRYAEIPIRFHKNIFPKNKFNISFFIGPSLFYPLKNNSEFISIDSYNEKLEGKSDYLHGDTAPLLINTELGLNTGVNLNYSFLGFHYNYSVFLTSLNRIENIGITEKLQVSNFSFYIDLTRLIKILNKNHTGY